MDQTSREQPSSLPAGRAGVGATASVAGAGERGELMSQVRVKQLDFMLDRGFRQPRKLGGVTHLLVWRVEGSQPLFRPVTLAHAALGAEIKVKTLDGTEDLKIPAERKPVRLSHQITTFGGRGDLFVVVTLITPKTLTKESENCSKLAEIEDKDFNSESFIEKVRNIFG